MTIQTGQSITVLFTTRTFSTGAATDATGTPTGAIYVNGTADAATVTVTKLATGLYKAQVTMPTISVGDEVQLLVTATVGGVTDSAVIWGDTKDVVAASGIVSANTTQLAGQTVTAAAGVTFPTSVASPTNITAGTITTVTNLTNAPTNGDFTAAMKTSLNAATPASVTTVTGNVDGSVGSVTGAVGSVTGAVGSVTGAVGSVTAAVTVDGASTLTEAYATAGGALTLAKALYGINQQLGNMSISGTTMTVKNRAGEAAKTYTLDDATTPTSITEAT